jgi:hypothetical protein
MLYEFLNSNRDELIRRCRDKVAKRVNAPGMQETLENGVPLFLRQLSDILFAETMTTARPVAGAGSEQDSSDVGGAARLNGAEMLRAGYSVDQVVHGYGDVCQSITEMAIERKKGISADEFHTLNRCLDDAIADAVKAYGSAHQSELNERAEVLHDSLDQFMKGQWQLLDTAIQSYAAIKTGNLGMNGATGALLIHSLEEMRALAERAVPAIRLASAKTTLS